MTDLWLPSKAVVGHSEVVIELHHLPCFDYFACLLQYNTIRLEACENFPKQTYRNRCYVLTANKVDVLTIPVKNSRKKIRIKDIQIDYNQSWIKRHWGCLQSAYGKSPYFEHYYRDLETIYLRKPTFLFDFNLELLTLCLKNLGIKKRIEYTLSYTVDVDITQFDAKLVVNDKKKGESAVFCNTIPYYQTFGNDFVPNLSIIDLLFNKGPEARKVLLESIQVSQEHKLNKAAQ
jgi:hypothetical protein